MHRAKIIYRFHPITKEFITRELVFKTRDEVRETDKPFCPTLGLDPDCRQLEIIKKGEFIFPENCTEVEPILAGNSEDILIKLNADKYVTKRNEEIKEWYLELKPESEWKSEWKTEEEEDLEIEPKNNN